VIDKRDGWC
jgi:hypothetical protein